MTRHIIVVDTETNGLDPARHQAVEVAWWNLTTGRRGGFIPKHNPSTVLADADVKALQINRYIDRIADRIPPNDVAGRVELMSELRGNTLAGSNPSFDAAMLTGLYRPSSVTDPEGWRDWRAPWHHRMWDLSAHAAGVLGLSDLPGLAKVCELLGVDPGESHTAESDVTATGLCFEALFARTAADRELAVAG